MKQMYELIFKKVAREEDFFFFLNFMFLWLKSHLSVHPYVRPFMHPPFSLRDLGLCSDRGKVVELSGNWSGGEGGTHYWIPATLVLQCVLI